MAVSAASLVGRAVRWRGIRVGTAAEVLFDRLASRAVGIVVACGDGGDRFLPLAAAGRLDGEIELVEPLAIGSPDALPQYFERGLPLSRLVGARIGRDGTAARIVDVLVDDEGAVEEIVSDAGGRYPPGAAELADA